MNTIIPRFILCFVTLAVIQSCSNQRKVTDSGDQLENIDIAQIEYRIEKHKSEQRTWDLHHTKLDLKPDWKNSELEGKASLRLTPYFYPMDTLIIDAIGFAIADVVANGDTLTKGTTYTYDGKCIIIRFDTLQSTNDTCNLFISYLANPNALVDSGVVKPDQRGLYFINSDKSDQDKPVQLWSQGETEANSCWFPTIDAPNERMTQEIYLTVDSTFKTISNGLLIYSRQNEDGTRTDYWKQSLPAAPYLTMIAVGDYAVVRDIWRELQVDYYVEPEFREFAKLIFGKTPAMLEFYSEILGVEYPWEKYSQVVVRDFVSGAMENTTAVIHGDFMQLNDREYLDYTGEDIIAHELFHHWFGNLVTCESWSNLPLNESFATYGEYLWIEHEHGRDEADYHLLNDLDTYLSQAKRNMHPLINYSYVDAADMFDQHSYQKGGRILHLLRNHVGDDAFFKGLKMYLELHKYNSVEIHDLRLVYEKITGEDLNWFFDQWFLQKGHPKLDITYTYQDSTQNLSVVIEQQQEMKEVPIFRIPLAIEVYFNGQKKRHEEILISKRNTFNYILPSSPDLVNIDADKIILCEKNEPKTDREWRFMYYNAPLFLDRYEAINGIQSADTFALNLFYDALDDKFWRIRNLAMENLFIDPYLKEEMIKDKLISIARSDDKSATRSMAITTLDRLFPGDSTLLNVFLEVTEDRAYSVVGNALRALAKTNMPTALEVAAIMENETSSLILSTIAGLYAEYGNEKQHAFFVKNLTNTTNINQFSFIQSYGDYLVNQEIDQIEQGAFLLEDVADENTDKWARLAAFMSLKVILEFYRNEGKELEQKSSGLSKKSAEVGQVLSEKASMNGRITRLEGRIKGIAEKEMDPKVKRFMGIFGY